MFSSLIILMLLLGIDFVQLQKNNGDVYEALAKSRTVHGVTSRPNGLLPDWIDLNLARGGQVMANRFYFQIMFGHLMGLITTFLFPDSFSILMSTGAAETIHGASMRYIATSAQVSIWYRSLFGPTPDSVNHHNLLTSIRNVRRVHKKAAAKAAKKMANNEKLYNANYWGNLTVVSILNGPFFKDLKASSIPISQRGNPLPTSSWTNITSVPVNQQGFALTQFVFVVFPVYFAQQMGIAANEADLWAYNHLWAVLGYALGIDDKYNVALHPSLASAKAAYKKIWERYFIPSLFLMEGNKPLLGFIDLMCQSMQKIAADFVTPNVLLNFLLEGIMGINSRNSKAAFSSKDKTLHGALQKNKENVLNTVLLGVANDGVNVAFFAKGQETYGQNYTIEDTRAQYVFWPEPPLPSDDC